MQNKNDKSGDQKSAENTRSLIQAANGKSTVVRKKPVCRSVARNGKSMAVRRNSSRDRNLKTTKSEEGITKKGRQKNSAGSRTPESKARSTVNRSIMQQVKSDEDTARTKKSADNRSVSRVNRQKAVSKTVSKEGVSIEKQNLNGPAAPPAPIRTSKSMAPNAQTAPKSVMAPVVDVPDKSEKNDGTREALFNVGRTVKRFVSRPIDGDKLKKMAERLKGVMEKEKDNKSMIAATSALILRGEDVKPKKSNFDTTAEESAGNLNEFTCEGVEEENMQQNPELPQINNENNGKLFIRGEPFWVHPRKPSKLDLESIPEDPECNAETIIKVNEGSIKLKLMPPFPVAIDPQQNDVETMKKRDKMYFSREIVFSNTVRSIINLFDPDYVQAIIDTREGLSKIVQVKDATQCSIYKRARPSDKPRMEEFAPGQRNKKQKEASERAKKGKRVVKEKLE